MTEQTRRTGAAERGTTDLEAVLDFCVDLSRRMIVSGANIERVQLAIERITYTYGLKDVSQEKCQEKIARYAAYAETIKEL